MMKFAFSIKEACAVSSTGKTKLYEEIKAGRLIARKRGKRTVILFDDLQSWMRSWERVRAANENTPSQHQLRLA